MTQPVTPTLADAWLTQGLPQALTSELMLICGGVFLLSLICLVLLVRATIRLGAAQRAQRRAAKKARRDAGAGNLEDSLTHGTPSSVLADQRGTTSIEFALVFPALLILVLMLIQTMLLMAGNVYVHYAAFAATREATIIMGWGEYDVQSGQTLLLANEYEEGGAKHERIRRAACWALLPAAGRQDYGAADGQGVADAMHDFYAAFGRRSPNWIDALVAQKMYYAEAHTQIQVLETLVIDADEVEFNRLPSNPYTFGVRDPITVRVIHKLNLGVPFAGRLFMDGEHDGVGPGRYSTVTARFTLTNEGVPAATPPRPEIDRLTPNLPSVDPNDYNDNLGDDYFEIAPPAGGAGGVPNPDVLNELNNALNNALKN